MTSSLLWLEFFEGRRCQVFLSLNSLPHYPGGGFSSGDTPNCRATVVKARPCGSGRSPGKLVCRILAWHAWRPWPWGAPWPLDPSVTSQGAEISVWVRGWSESVSGLEQWQAGRDSLSPTEGYQQIATPSLPAPMLIYQLLWSTEVPGRSFQESGLPRLWLALGFPWRLLPAAPTVDWVWQQ